MSVAASWYESGTFWAIAAVGVGVIFGIATIVVTYRVGFPRRRLFYGMRNATPLLSAPTGLRSDFELRHRGSVLTEPHIVDLLLVTRGRRDIPSSSYDRGEPIRLDVGAPILRILQSTSSSPSIPDPATRIDGTTLAIGPGLLGRRHKLTYSLLVDGPPQLSGRCSLTDVRVDQVDDFDEIGTMPRVVKVLGFIAAPLLGVTGSLLIKILADGR